MYEVLIAHLRECAKLDASNSTYAEAANAIEELQAAEKKYLANISALETENQHLKRERDWITVTERLPEHDMNVLICYEWTGRSGTAYTEVGIASIEELERDPTEMFRPLYWMPLPVPPKEE